MLVFSAYGAAFNGIANAGTLQQADLPKNAKIEGIVNEIDKSGIKVQINPKAPYQEGNVTLIEGKLKVNLRVETHPLPESNGVPVRHGNVEAIEKVGNNVTSRSNKHVL